MIIIDILIRQGMHIIQVRLDLHLLDLISIGLVLSV